MSQNHTVELPQHLIDSLINVAKQKSAFDDLADDEFYVADDYAGGNIDDAFNNGMNEGNISMARLVLTTCGINWE